MITVIKSLTKIVRLKEIIEYNSDITPYYYLLMITN